MQTFQILAAICLLVVQGKVLHNKEFSKAVTNHVNKIIENSSSPPDTAGSNNGSPNSPRPVAKQCPDKNIRAKRAPPSESEDLDESEDDSEDDSDVSSDDESEDLASSNAAANTKPESGSKMDSDIEEDVLKKDSPAKPKISNPFKTTAQFKNDY